MPNETDNVSALHTKYVNKRALLTVETSLRFAVMIKDARPKFGRVDLLIRPMTGAGDGERWVSADRVEVQP